MSIQGESLMRPSKIYCEAKIDNGFYNIKVGGQAKIVLKGFMYL